ncbi:putative methyltransferase [Goodfellowiella coeruleoviolacea]|uniref:Methyltransferase n=1 Tax=Goodfellowiella coeruleoviolacea TaxID=334858 RepID=A0AAE3KH72_9PSEU|nr:putative methyltransferase [Goodfellowiella coeruleoviolacea]
MGALLRAHGVHGRPLRRALALLCAGWQPFDEVVRQTALPRRTVQELVEALGEDVRHDPRGEVPRLRVAAELAGDYRRRFGLDTRPPDDPFAELAAAHPDLLATIRADIADAPPPLPAMDHVPATAETVLRRALWLAEHYDLTGGRLLCLGDHDLTSLAVCAVNPDVAVTVVDLDERILEFIETRAAQRGWNIRCLHADLRFGFPPSAQEWADLVFTDPPYTPEGMALFVGRGVSALRDVANGRVLVAYGYSARNPALGLKVQQEVQRLGVVFEAVLPGFNRYQGAQAVGSASDLYVCRPTARSAKLALSGPTPAGTARAGAGRSAAGRTGTGRTGIYTHGPQSIEASEPAADVAESVWQRLRELAARPGSSPAPKPRGPGWDEPVGKGASALAVDLTGDPGPWLLRTLLACAAGRMAALVPNNHPDIGSERAQRDLADLVAARFQLRFLRSTPDSRHAVVVAEHVPVGALDAGGLAVREVLLRAHGKLGNVWREALVTASRGELTKRQARERVEAHAPADVDLDVRLIDLPRHRLAPLLATITTTAS